METEENCTPRRRLDFDQPDINNERMSFIHARMPKQIIPEKDREFETEEGAYVFYNAYALEAGFSIRRSKSPSAKDGKILYRTFSCSREGKRGDDKRITASTVHRPETRCSCPAKLKISCRGLKKYKIVKFIAEHSHDLETPSKAHLFRSHRNMSEAQGPEVNMIDGSGIAPRLGFELMSKQVGGREHVGFTRTDYKNHLRTKRSLAMKSGDASGILEYLQKKQIKDPKFFYAIQVDEDDLITNIFWADAKMMADYEAFGDVVCFDTTYRKHKDGRPIALYVGVNNHKQTCVFGVALLYDETAETFMWLFDTFSKAMDEKLPKTILTDQDAAMAKALASEWSQTCHRLCVWHIFQNAATHLSSEFSKFKEFSKEFSSCVYDYEHEDDFLDPWKDMIFKYDLQSNEWLNRMFQIKEKWALVYGRDRFCADMTTTQRSESMKKHIKGYVSYKHDLRRFFLNFERLLRDRGYDETTADFKARQSAVVLTLALEILKHAASVYTPAVLRMFQLELTKAYDCNIVNFSGTEDLLIYTMSPFKKRYNYVVSYYKFEEKILCACRKFEFVGILCSYALKVFSDRGVTKIPNAYILKRWTIKAKEGNARNAAEVMADEDPKAKVGRRYRDLCYLSRSLTTRGAESEEAYGTVREALVILFEQLCCVSGDKGTQMTSKYNHGATNERGGSVIVDSTGLRKTVKGVKVKTKCGNSSKRPKGALEKACRRKRQKQKEQIPDIKRGPVTSQSIQDSINTLTQYSSQVLPSDSSLPLPQVTSSSEFIQVQSSQLREVNYQQMTSYQDLLNMNYPAVENLLYDKFEPTQNGEGRSNAYK